MSPPQQIPVQLLLYKTTDHLLNTTSNHFFCLPNEKNLSNTTTKTLASKEIGNKHKEQCIKNKCLSVYIYSIATL